jgi:hypothetical protein
MLELQRELCELGAELLGQNSYTEKWQLKFAGPPNSPYQYDHFLIDAFLRLGNDTPSISFGSETQVCHTFFCASMNVPLRPWHHSYTIRKVIDRVRFLLMLPEFEGIGNMNQNLSIYQENAEKYFRMVAEVHNYEVDITPEIIESWKAHVQENIRQEELEVNTFQIFQISKIIEKANLTWSPQNHAVFRKCPNFQELVLLLLLENNRSYGISGNLLGIPKPLILEIIQYVANDFFHFKTLCDIGAYLDCSWTSGISEVLIPVIQKNILILDPLGDKLVSVIQVHEKRKTQLQVSADVSRVELFFWAGVFMGVSPDKARMISGGREVLFNGENPVSTILGSTVYCIARPQSALILWSTPFYEPNCQ